MNKQYSYKYLYSLSLGLVLVAEVTNLNDKSCSGNATVIWGPSLTGVGLFGIATYLVIQTKTKQNVLLRLIESVGLTVLFFVLVMAVMLSTVPGGLFRCLQF